MTAYVKVPLRLIRPGRNIRSDPELPGIEDLAESIRALGVLQPITLIPRGAGYEIVFGHRRYAAARKAGLAEIPAIVLPPGTARDGLIARQVAENTARVALNPMDEAKGYAQLRTLGKTAQQVARICGVSTATVYTRLALLDLPKAEQQQVETGALPLAQAGEVAKLIRRREAGAVRHQREPAHFTSRHHLWAAVKLTCTHRAERPVIGGAGCAQCWEAAIREDERNRIRGR